MEAANATPPFLREFALAQRSITETQAQMGDQRGRLRRTIAELREALLSSVDPEQPSFNVTPHPTTMGDGGDSTTAGGTPLYVSCSKYTTCRTITEGVLRKACETSLVKMPGNRTEEEREEEGWRSTALDLVMAAVKAQVVSRKPTIKVGQKPPAKTGTSKRASDSPSPPTAADERIAELVRELYAKEGELARLGDSQRHVLAAAKDQVEKLTPLVSNYLMSRDDDDVQVVNPVGATGLEAEGERLTVSLKLACKKPRIGLTKLRDILQGALARCEDGQSPDEVGTVLCATLVSWMEENDKMLEKLETAPCK